jgi:type IV secretory pathway VirB3-like protein
MTEPIKEEVRKTAEGKDAATPARLLFGVAVTVWVAAGVLTVVLFLVYWLVAR